MFSGFGLKENWPSAAVVGALLIPAFAIVLKRFVGTSKFNFRVIALALATIMISIAISVTLILTTFLSVPQAVRIAILALGPVTAFILIYFASLAQTSTERDPSSTSP